MKNARRGKAGILSTENQFFNNLYIMDYTLEDRVAKYIDVLEPINEGLRNKSLHNAGLLLRKNFGLTGDALLSALSDVNRTKCSPPLPDSDVTTIAHSVDRSNIPIGETTTAYKGQHGKKASKPERKKHVVFVSADSVSVDTLRSKAVSVYPNCRASTQSKTSTVGKVLETFRTGGKSKEVIETVRSEPDKDKRNELKQGIPAVVFSSEPQTERKVSACKPNGILCLDFDNIPPEELETAKRTIAEVPYVFVAGLQMNSITE